MIDTTPHIVTVDEALKRGQRIIRYPQVFIIVIFVLLSLIITSAYDLSPFLTPVMVLAGVFLACLYESNVSVSWRLWAFENVRNVNDLKTQAIKKGLMDAKPNFFTRLELWTPTQKKRWEALQYKFNQPDLFTDDDTIPAETVVCYSKSIAVIYIIVGFCILCLAAWLGFKHHRWVSITFSAILGVASLTMGIALFYNRKPQIIINADGITAPPGSFYNWGQIHNEDVIQATSGKTRPHYLVYEHGTTSEKVNLTGFDIYPDRLAYLLKVYRGRSKKR